MSQSTSIAHESLHELSKGKGVVGRGAPKPTQLPTEGITTAAVRGLFGPLQRPRRSRTAFIGCCVKEHFPYDKACRNFRAACAAAIHDPTAADVEIIPADHPFEDPRELIGFLNQLLVEPLAGVILVHASYTAGEIGAHLGRWLVEHQVPMLSWSFPDERGGAMQSNSLCCQNFLLNMWRRMGVRYAWMHEAVGGDAPEPLGRFLRSTRARDRFRHGRVLHAGGSRVTGFYDGEADELALMRRFGLQFDRVDLQVVAELARDIAAEEVGLIRETLLRHPQCGAIDVPDVQVDQTLRFGLAIYKLAAQQGYIGCTVKSWPEMFSCYGCAIDGAVSLLNDAGLCTAEEGDMCALVTSLAMHLLTDGSAIPVTMDLSSVDARQNRLGIWHCGACPTRVLKRGTLFEARRHSILENADPASALGLVLEFLLELGPATVARYQSPDAATMLAFEGSLVDTPLAFRGSYCELEPRDASASQIVATILSSGLDHHWGLGYGSLGDDLAMLNHWLDVKSVPLVDSRRLDGLSH